MPDAADAVVLVGGPLCGLHTQVVSGLSRFRIPVSVTAHLDEIQPWIRHTTKPSKLNAVYKDAGRSVTENACRCGHPDCGAAITYRVFSHDGFEPQP